MAGLGSWLTGQKDGTDEPTKSIFGGVGDTLNQKIFDDPASRAALLQIGLNLMQPVGIGQTAGGHLAQAIGAGGEEVTREEERQRKQDQAEEEMAIKERQAGAREREVGFYGEGVKNKNVADRTAIENAKLDLKREQGTDAKYYDQLKIIMDHIKSAALINPDDQWVKMYGGKTPGSIIQMLKDEDAQRVGGGGGTRSSADQQALDWAKANPDDPRSKQILQRLGVQ